MSHVKDFRADILRQQIMELQRFLKALENNNLFKKDCQIGVEPLSNIELQLKKLRQELKKKFLMY